MNYLNVLDWKSSKVICLRNIRDINYSPGLIGLFLSVLHSLLRWIATELINGFMKDLKNGQQNILSKNVILSSDHNVNSIKVSNLLTLTMCFRWSRPQLQSLGSGGRKGGVLIELTQSHYGDMKHISKWGMRKMLFPDVIFKKVEFLKHKDKLI